MFINIQNTTDFSMLHIYHQFINMFGDVDDLMKCIDKIYILDYGEATARQVFLDDRYITSKLFTVSRLLSLPKYVGLGTKIKIAGIKRRRRKKKPGQDKTRGVTTGSDKRKRR